MRRAHRLLALALLVAMLSPGARAETRLLWKKLPSNYDSLVFSADGKHFGFRVPVATIDGKSVSYVVHDGKIRTPFPLAAVQESSLQLDASGRIVYLVKLPTGEHVVTNDRRGPRYDAIERLTFSPDGAHSYYIGTLGAEGSKLRRSRLVLDGRPGPLFAEIGRVSRWSKTNRLAYYAIKDGKGYVVFGAKLFGPLVRLWALGFDPHDRLYAFVWPEMYSSRTLTHLGKLVASPYHRLHRRVFDRTGTRQATVVTKVSGTTDYTYRQHVLQNGTLSPPYDETGGVGAILFAGRYLVYVACSGRCFLVHQGKRSSSSFEAIDQLRVSADGTRWAYVGTQKGSQRIVSGHLRGDRLVETSGPPYPKIESLALSADGKRVAAVVHVAGNRERVWSNGTLGPAFYHVYRPQISPRGTLIYRVREVKDGESRYRLVRGSTASQPWRYLSPLVRSKSKVSYLHSDGRALWWSRIEVP